MNYMASEELRKAVKLADRPAYKLAHKAGVSASQLSAWLCGITPVRPGDERLIRVGAIVGVPPDRCFATRRNA